MYKHRVAMVLGVVLSAGMLMAQTQQPAPEQSGQTAADASTGQVYPASGHHHRMTAKKQLEYLSRMLNLSPDQQGQILPILKEHRQQLRQLRADKSLSKQDRRMKMRALNQESRARLEAVLNDQQRQEFEQAFEQRRQHGYGQAPEPAPSQPQS